jgi:hypothetical protein
MLPTYSVIERKYMGLVARLIESGAVSGLAFIAVFISMSCGATNVPCMDWLRVVCVFC